MQRFLDHYGADVTGVIEGYDWLRLRGSLRHLSRPTVNFRSLFSACSGSNSERWFLTADGAEIADKTCRR